MTPDDLKNLKAKLPKFPGIQAKEKYFNSAVLIPLVIRHNECHLLFQKRANHIRQGGEICFPGGQHDPRYDKNYQDTAIRETIEELGIVRNKISIIGQLDTYLAPQGVTVDPFIGILDIRDVHELSIDPNEVERVFLMPVSYFERTTPEVYHVRVEVQPSYIDKDGKEHILLPAEELGLPARYWKPWGGRKYRVLFYPTQAETIWGMTAAMIYDLIQKL